MSLAYRLYNGLYPVLWGLSCPYLRWVRRRSSDYIRARFTPPSLPKKNAKRVWIHAVSVGESNVAYSLAQTLRKRSSDWDVVISTSTPTGYENLVRKGDIPCLFSPWDRISVVREFIERIEPDKLIIIETELWPALIRENKVSGVGVYIVNARISDVAYRRYRWVKFFLEKEVFPYIDCVLCQDEKARERFLGLGARDVVVCGNIKYDIELEEKILGKWEEDLKGRFVVVLGSTHVGEEAPLLRALKGKRRDLFLIVAPRHPERTGQIREMLQEMGYSVQLLAELEKAGQVKGDALVIDRIGVLSQVYRLADLVFIGGSLVPKGGQNPLEAAYWARPIVFGPHMENFQEISEELLKQGAAIQITRPEEIERYLFSDDIVLIGNRAKDVLAKNRGVIQRIVEYVFEER